MDAFFNWSGWDVFFRWTGWAIAAFMAAWRIFDALRNRTIIKFFIGISVEEGIINHTVINVGRSPVILTKLELKFPDGYYCPIPQESEIFYGKLDYMTPRINRLNVQAIKTLIKKLADEGMKKIAPKYICIVSDKGNKYKTKIPDKIRTELLR